MSDFKSKFWSVCKECETLTCTDPYDAVEEYLDDLYPTPIKDLSDEVIVSGFEPMEVPEEKFAEFILEDLLERIDEEFGDPSGQYTNPTAKMVKSSRDFVKTVVEEFDIWACELSGEQITVNLKEYVRENHPDWDK